MNKRLTFLALSVVLLCVGAQGQPVRSGYFLPGMFNRTKINPSVINQTGYVGIPIISDISVGMSSNVGLQNFIFPYSGGGLTTFMNSSVSASDFLKNMSPVSGMNIDLSLDIFSAGYFAGKSYQTIALTFRSMSNATVPYALFDFMKSGMSNPSTHYAIKDMGLQTQNFVELAWSYARPINEQWTVGGRAKFLVGLAYADARISQMDITMSANEWLVSSRGQLSASAVLPLRFGVGSDGTVSGVSTGGGISPSFGFSFDFGATYKPAKRWTVSLAATDVGVIFWNNVAQAATQNTPFSFKGFQDIPIGGSERSIQSQLEALQQQAMGLIKFYPTASSTRSDARWLKATINVGGEYEIFEDLFSVGLLSSTRIDPVYTVSDLIVSANYRPSNGWFNASLTGDFSNVAVSCGAVINFCPKFLNFFLGLDYMVWNVSPQLIPLSAIAPRLSLGLSVPLRRPDRYYKNRH